MLCWKFFEHEFTNVGRIFGKSEYHKLWNLGWISIPCLDIDIVLGS
jgi:hypothetical protein